MAFEILDPLGEGFAAWDGEEEEELEFWWDTVQEDKVVEVDAEDNEKPVKGKRKRKPASKPAKAAGKESKGKQFCSYWTGMEGSCKMGNRCKFIHSEEGVKEWAARQAKADAESPLQKLIGEEVLSRRLFYSPYSGDLRVFAKALEEKLKAKMKEPCKIENFHPNETKNYCFVTFLTPEHAGKMVGVAVETASFTSAGSRPMGFNPNSKFLKTPLFEPKSTATNPNRLFVAGLYDTWYFSDPSRLASIFSFIGPVKAVEQTQRRAFVEYESPDDADKAIKIFNGNKYAASGGKKKATYTLEVRKAINKKG